MLKKNKTEEQYDDVVAEARDLMRRKNSDYGDSWRVMRPTSITDQIYVKILRIRQLEELQKRGVSPQLAEGIESELRDILNYAAFEIIQIREEHHENITSSSTISSDTSERTEDVDEQ